MNIFKSMDTIQLRAKCHLMSELHNYSSKYVVAFKKNLQENPARIGTTVMWNA